MSTTDHYGTLFPTAVVGSMPRSAFVRDLVLEPTGTDRQVAALDAAVSYIAALQQEVGLDVVTDGEWRRPSYIGVIAQLANGFSTGSHPADGRPWTIVVDKLSPRQPGRIAAEIRFLKQVTASRIKATLPAPALLGERLWDAKLSAKAYPTRRNFVEALVPILRREIELLQEEAVDIVQIDDPHLCLFVDPEIRAASDDPDGDADFAAAMTNEMLEGIPNVRLALHLCRRAGARVRGDAQYRGGYEAIINQLNRLSVQHLSMEFTAPGAGNEEIFRHLREDLEVGLGCVSVQPGLVDDAATIVERVERALVYLSPERIVLNPDCGFAPGSAAPVDLDEVYAKLRHMVEAACRLRQKYT